MWFSDPYVPYRQVLVVPSSSTASQPSDLNQSGKRVTALTGSTAADLAHRLFPSADTVELEQQPALLEVSSGRADGVIVGTRPGIIKQSPTVRLVEVLDGAPDWTL